VDLDLPLTADGKWAVRVTGAAQDGGSYLRSYHHKRTAVSSVLDGEITPNLHLSAGYMRQDGNSTGVMWGALPLQDSKGNQLEYDTSASTTMDWTYWKTRDETAYGQLTWDFAPGWSARARHPQIPYRGCAAVLCLWHAHAKQPERRVGRPLWLSRLLCPGGQGLDLRWHRAGRLSPVRP
jgi:hypothetical protein